MAQVLRAAAQVRHGRQLRALSSVHFDALHHVLGADTRQLWQPAYNFATTLHAAFHCIVWLE
jgi:hypothetical protein